MYICLGDMCQASILVEVQGALVSLGAGRLLSGGVLAISRGYNVPK